MSLRVRIRNTLRGLKQRWGTSELKRSIWDKEYAEGRWDHCDHSPDAPVYAYVERHCANGSILDLGCGSGNTGTELRVDKYQRYVGVDISEVAVQKAAERSKAHGRGEKNAYAQGDITAYVPTQKFDLILFRESIYYIPRVQIKNVLERYTGYLTDRGVMVVHVGKGATKKGREIFEIIAGDFQVVEGTPHGDAFTIVFKARA